MKVGTLPSLLLSLLFKDGVSCEENVALVMDQVKEHGAPVD